MKSVTGGAIKKIYDVVVVGSGIGGLTAAALLAKAGKSVLVVERHDRPGGYAHGFRRKKYCFDSGVHLTSGCGMKGYAGGQVIRKVLQAVDVFDEIEFIPVKFFSRAVFPQFSCNLPTTLNAFIDKLGKSFPDQQQGLTRLLALCLQLTEELAIADELLATGCPEEVRENLPALFQYRRATLDDVWNQFLTDPKLKAVFATNWPYLGLPPSKVSFIYWATMLIGYLVDGAYYCKGGFQKLADTLVNGVTRNGGEVVFKVAVRKIHVDQGKVQAIVLSSGQTIKAPVVISNADMRQTVYGMVGEAYFPKRFLQRMTGMSHSLSIFAVYIATDLDLHRFDLAHESFCYQGFDHDQTYQRLENSELSFISISVPTLIDASLAPEGEHIVLLTTLLPYDAGEPWKQLKPKILQQMLDRANEQLPGLKEHLLFVDAGSPETMERYTLNHQGAAYGWQVTPRQVGPNRIANRSPIPGLYFAGHWSSPGGGIYGVCVSGMQAAQQVLGITGQQDLWNLLSSDETAHKREVCLN